MDEKMYIDTLFPVSEKVLANAVILHLKSLESVQGARRTKRLKFQHEPCMEYCLFRSFFSYKQCQPGVFCLYSRRHPYNARIAFKIGTEPIEVHLNTFQMWHDAISAIILENFTSFRKSPVFS